MRPPVSSGIALRVWALLLLLGAGFGTARGQSSGALSAGEIVSAEEVARTGAESFFSAVPIGEEIEARIRGKSYKANCTVPFNELRYLSVLHYDLNGEIKRGEMVCNRLIADDLLEIFRVLFDARYPIERMVLIDDYDADDERSMLANNSSAFNFRFIAGTNKLSNHSRGLAVDINPLYNPYVKRRKDGTLFVSPEAARPYADRSREFPCKIDAEDLCCREFLRHGFVWGGGWHSLKDYQHFEKRLK